MTFATLLLAAAVAVPTPQQDSELYRVTLIRAAPGRLLDVIDAYRQRMPFYDAAGEARPAIVRHSQGDQWDLMVIQPVGSLPGYYGSERVGRRVQTGERLGTPPHAFDDMLRDMVAWREDTFFVGGSRAEFERRFAEAGYFHIEMFVALPGKAQELIREREMENDFLRRIGRSQNLIFSRALGGAWNSFTIGFYRNLQHYAEPTTMSADDQQAAAIAAGFEGADRIGTYLRTLIASHHDTLGTKAIP